MKIRYDRSSDAAYIEFDITAEEGLRQDHVDGEWPINVDVSKDGKVMGVEILNASTMLSAEFLQTAK